MGAKQSGTATTTQKLDPQMQAMIGQLFGSTLGAAGIQAPAQQGPTPWNGQGGRMGMVMQALRNHKSGQGGGNGMGGLTPSGPEAQPIPGVDPMSEQAGGYYGGAMDAGQMGFNALTGDQNALQQMYNPYQSNVIDGVNQQYDQMRGKMTNDINSQATLGGAFGGSRHGVAQGQMMGDVGRAQMEQVGGLQYQGFNDAMGRAGGLANLGLGAAGAAHGMGEYRRQVAMQQDPAMRRIEMLKGAIHGTPYGTTTSQPMYSNPLGTIAGLGMSAASLFSPGGLLRAGASGGPGAGVR